MKVRALLVSTLVLAMMWLAGCDHYVCKTTFGNATCASSSNNNGGGLTGSVYAYFMNDNAGQMAAVAVNYNNSQTFAPIANWVPPPVLCGHACFSVDGGLVIVNKAYIYMPYSDGNVYAYGINATTAALSVLPAVNLGLPQFVASPIAADPAGKYVFVGDSAGVYSMSVGSTGTLTVTNSGQPFPGSGVQPTYMAFDGLGHHLYVADGTLITAYSFDSSTGALTSVGTIQSAVTMLTGEPSGNFMIGTTQSNGAGGTALDNNVYVFGITPSTGTNPGSLSNPAVVSTPQTPSFIAVSPNVENGSELVYTFNLDDNSTGLTALEPIVEFPFNPSTGALGTPSTSTFLSSVGHFDQSGNFLIDAGQSATSNSAGVLALEVTTTGALENNLPSTGQTSLSFAVTDEP